MMAKPKPCPFCGSTDLTYSEYWCRDFTGFFVKCQNCDASTTAKETKRAAKKAWNTRVSK